MSIFFVTHYSDTLLKKLTRYCWHGKIRVNSKS